mmetsp:Transcript_22674/g.21848  ORF Transcript_22674/g.21848 Transcript_22674/m.21848 type:complete len:231 (+) Transcript_22674:967-1659(+)
MLTCLDIWLESALLLLNVKLIVNFRFVLLGTILASADSGEQIQTFVSMSGLVARSFVIEGLGLEGASFFSQSLGVILLVFSPVLVSLLGGSQENFYIWHILAVCQLFSLFLSQLVILVTDQRLVRVSGLRIHETLAVFLHLALALDSVDVEAFKISEDFSMAPSLQKHLQVIIEGRQLINGVLPLLFLIFLVLVLLFEVFFSITHSDTNDVEQDQLERVHREAFILLSLG